MTVYRERFYRKRIKAADLVSFQVSVRETDLWVSAERVLEKETRDLVLSYRRQVQAYIDHHDFFLKTLQPCPEDPFAPPIIRAMIRESTAAGVGPMASIAGAIAQFVGMDLLQWTDQVIIENGGDIFLKVNRPVTVSIFAGKSPLSEKIGLKIPVRLMPAGVCASSGTVGHSLSLGRADVVCLLSPSAILSDAAATALCNLVKNKKDLGELPAKAGHIRGIGGGVAIMGDTMATWGDIEIIGL